MRQTLRGGWTAVLVDQERRWLDIVEGRRGASERRRGGNGSFGFAAGAVAWLLLQTDTSVTMAIQPSEQDLRQATIDLGQPVRRVRPLSSRR